MTVLYAAGGRIEWGGHWHVSCPKLFWLADTWCWNHKNLPGLWSLL